MNIGDKIAELRKNKNWSQNDLANKIGVSRVIIGRYEKNDALPSIEIAKKIADCFEVSLDYLVGEGQNAKFDKKTIQRLNDIHTLESDKKKTLFDLIDTYIRDFKSRKTYAL